MKPSEIKCGGGLMLLDDGTYSYYIEIHFDGQVFNFECENTFPDEDAATDKLKACVVAFPYAIVEAAEERDFKIVDDFCTKWDLFKSLPPEVTADDDEELGEDDSLH